MTTAAAFHDETVMRKSVHCLVSVARTGARPLERKVLDMLLTIAAVIFVLWLLGLVAIPASGGLIHVLLVIAVIVIIAHFMGIGRSSASV